MNTVLIFNAPSLIEVFRRNGFEVLGTAEAFEGQYLTIEARPVVHSDPSSHPDAQALQSIFQDVDTFAENYREKAAAWQACIEQIRQKQQKAVIWGAGSKGITFLNAFQSRDVFEYVVDTNPRKTGMYITGTGQKIVSPGFLSSYKPEVVIIMNANYKEEIQKTLVDFGVQAEVLLA